MDTLNHAPETFSSYSNLEVESCLDHFAIEHESIVLNNFSLVMTLLAQLFTVILL